ncbi:MAG: prepilin peptidase [Patescibacteria group bacterium]
MSLLVFMFVAALGAIIGSFLNALSFRFNTGRSMGGRSRCMHCRHELAAADLVPIFSYLFLRGKCRYCHARISSQYPLVEGTALVLAVFTYISHPDPASFAFWFVVWMILLFSVIYDIRHTIIPWSCSLSLIALAFLYVLSHEPSFFDFLAGPLLALPLFTISLLSWGRWMGWADGVLELSLGWLLGLAVGFTALVLAFWSGAIVGTLLLLVKKRYTMKSEIPFAPFLILGAAVAHFFHVDFFSAIQW